MYLFVDMDFKLWLLEANAIHVYIPSGSELSLVTCVKPVHTTL